MITLFSRSSESISMEKLQFHRRFSLFLAWWFYCPLFDFKCLLFYDYGNATSRCQRIYFLRTENNMKSSFNSSSGSRNEKRKKQKKADENCGKTFSFSLPTMNFITIIFHSLSAMNCLPFSMCRRKLCKLWASPSLPSVVFLLFYCITIIFRREWSSKVYYWVWELLPLPAGREIIFIFIWILTPSLHFISLPPTLPSLMLCVLFPDMPEHLSHQTHK